MAKKTIDKNYEYRQIAKERSIWLIKPVVLLSIVVWAIYPATVMPGHLEQNMLMGFLLGAVAGILLNLAVFRYYLFSRRLNTRERKNRMPDEYYIGRIKEILYLKED